MRNIILMKLDQFRRTQRIRNACANSSLFSNKVYRRKNLVKYLFSPKYKLSLCKVPSVGSTFWTQAIAVLNNGVDVAKDVFEMPKRSVHQKLTLPNLVKFDSEERLKSRSILVSRDPYSRLYSSYVDQILLPVDPTRIGPGKTIKNNLYFTDNGICQTGITFQEFLHEILNAVYKKKTLNRGLAPITSLCDPCKVSPIALVKEESFSKDVDFILQKIGISSDEFDVLHDALTDHRDEFMVPAIVYTVLKSTSRIKPCKTPIEIAKGIWASFQIQGLIRDGMPFPEELFGSEEPVEPGILSDLILETIKASPLNSEESKIQRHKFLANAYKNIDKKTIEGIQRIYKQDFVIFGYPFEPPSMLK